MPKYFGDTDNLGEVPIFVPESFADQARETLALRFIENDL